MRQQQPVQDSSQRKTALRASLKDQSEAGKRKIGEILRKEGLITQAQLEEALAHQKKHGGRIGSILVELGHIEPETIVNVLSRVHNFPAILITRNPPDAEALRILPFEIAKEYLAFPLKVEGNTLQVTMVEPTDTAAVGDLQNAVRMDLSVCVSSEKDILDAFRTYYKIGERTYRDLQLKQEVEEEEEDEPPMQVDDFGRLVSEASEDFELDTSDDEDDALDEYGASSAPVVKLVNGMLIKAVKDQVSDIHIEPFENALQVRYRLDGSLYRSLNLPVNIKNAVNSRIKILANMNIAERRLPQDGRIKIRVGKRRSVEFRVSSLPTLFGESLVLRILDKSSVNINLKKLGFDKGTFERLQRCIHRPYGLILVTGPTGSGKTTTLYSILNVLNSVDTKILTAEDPVEYNFKGINQVNVRSDIGLTFASALRAFLRQDPDIIMVGEIRDAETAEIAVKSAMTGHLVLSTLHTNDCVSTIARLVDIGIPPYMVSSAVSIVLSQRLARRLCPQCKQPETDLDPKELVSMGISEDEIPNLTIYGPVGCPECFNTGYKGRVGLYELLEVTEELAKAINAGIPEDQLRKIAMKEGMETLRESGLAKMRDGLTSNYEVLRHTVMTEETLAAYLISPESESYESGDVVIREGNTDKDFFELVQGALLVVAGGQKIGQIVEPGSFLGEIASISDEPRSATVIAQEKTVLKRYPGEKISEIIEKHPEITEKLIRAMTNRLRSNNQMLAEALMMIKKLKSKK
jgi:type IV pilus assembly protein PilB